MGAPHSCAQACQGQLAVWLRGHHIEGDAAQDLHISRGQHLLLTRCYPSHRMEKLIFLVYLLIGNKSDFKRTYNQQDYMELQQYKQNSTDYLLERQTAILCALHATRQPMHRSHSPHDPL